MLLSLTIIAALFIDYLFGEVRRLHPLVGFGNVASAVEKKLNRSCYPQKTLGILSWSVLVLPIPIILWSIQISENLSTIIDILVVYFAVGLNSLKTHVLDVYHALKTNDIDLAREKVSMIVSR
ncbi:MAG: cobalamin biosynthesis protein, partial [Kangiellaceae bacterium]|nr:cobalamin biosynthesis protein [Kangiellaceae bacterium]